MGKSYRNRIKRINKDVSTYLDKGPQDPGGPYKKKRKRLPTDINKLSAPPGAGALEEGEDFLLEQEQVVRDNLIRRGIDADRSHLFFDEEAGVATFLLFNLSGQLVGYQRYRPDAPKKFDKKSKTIRYFTYVTKNKTAVWGLDTLTLSKKRLFITEGIFDAAKLHRQGEAAIAVLTNAKDSNLLTWLSILPQKIIAILDRDDAGNSLKTGVDFFLTVPEPHKDLGDMTDSEVSLFLQESGIKNLKLMEKNVGRERGTTGSGTGMEEILEAWKMYVEQEEEASEIKNEEEGKDEDGLV